MKRSGFKKLSYEDALERKKRWAARQRVKNREKTSQKGVKLRKKGFRKKAKAPDPREKEFMAICRERDGFLCQYPGCGKYDRYIPVHHKMERSQRPDQRFNPDNGVCLCWSHHDFIHHTLTGRLEAKKLGLLQEETYELAQKEKKRLYESFK